MSSKEEFSIHEYIYILSRRKWIVILSLFSAIVSVLYFSITKADVYKSAATLFIEPGKSDFSFGTASRSYSSVRDLSFYEGVFESSSYRNSVIDSLGSIFNADGYDNDLANKALSGFGNTLVLEKLKYESYFRINAQAEDPKIAYTIATVATELYQNQIKTIVQDESLNSLEFIDEQLAMRKGLLEQAEKDIEKFKEEIGIFTLNIEGTEGSKDTQTISNEYIRLQDGFIKAKTEKEVAQAHLESLRKRLSQERVDPLSMRGSSSDDKVVQLRKELAGLEYQRQLLTKQFSESDTRIVQMDRRIEDLKSALVNQIVNAAESASPSVTRLSSLQNIRREAAAEELNVEVLNAREQYYNRLLENYKKQHPELLDQSLELARLIRGKEVHQQIYNLLLERGEEIKIKASSTTGGIKVIDPPALPVNAVPKKFALWLSLAAFIGLTLGVGLAMLLEYMDTTIKSEEEIKDNLAIPILGSIPIIKSEAGCLLNGDLRDPISETYRMVRTNLIPTVMNDGKKVFVVSSPGPVEGKSITTANLGIAYSQMGERVLIIDADLRKPRQHSLFNLEKEPGLGDILDETRSKKFSVIQHPTEFENLSVITCGKSIPNPPKLLSSEQMLRLLKFAKEKYDIILIDTPPVITVTDPMLLGGMSDGIMLILRSESTPLQSAEYALDLIKKSEVVLIGAILNDVDIYHRYNRYGYYYYYRYYGYHDEKKHKKSKARRKDAKGKNEEDNIPAETERLTSQLTREKDRTGIVELEAVSEMESVDPGIGKRKKGIAEGKEGNRESALYPGKFSQSLSDSSKIPKDKSLLKDDDNLIQRTVLKGQKKRNIKSPVIDVKAKGRLPRSKIGTDDLSDTVDEIDGVIDTLKNGEV